MIPTIKDNHDDNLAYDLIFEPMIDSPVLNRRVNPELAFSQAPQKRGALIRGQDTRETEKSEGRTRRRIPMKKEGLDAAG